MVWINEFHYDNTGADVGEFVEIAGAAGTDLTGWTLVLYNGNGGTTYTPTIVLSGIIPNQSNGFGVLSFAATGLQNGGTGIVTEADGFALVNALGVVVAFISYEGSFVATNGPAIGMTSVNVGAGIGEPGNANGTSIALIGTGDEASDFTWAVAADDTPGGVNVGQFFPAPAVGVSITTLDADKLEGNAGTTAFSFTVTRTNSAGAASVDWSLSNLGGVGRADAADFTSTGGTVNFIDGQASVTLTVQVVSDTTIEADEAFTVSLANPSAGLNIGTGIAQGVIRTDDVAPPAASPPWINEFHYDDDGGDTGEFIEIAGQAGLDLTGYSLVLYNGSNSMPYGTTRALSGIIPDQGGGLGTLSFAYPVDGIQNGSPDAIALIGPSGVIEFISYEGVITAVGGPADGMTSLDVGVFEPGNAPGTSIGRVGSGNEAADFNWALIGDDTPGGVNGGQTFLAPAPKVSVTDVSITEGPAGTQQLVFTLTRVGPTGAFTVGYATADGTALAGSDYLATSGTVSFTAAQTTATVSVTVNGDATAELDETFFLNLSNPTDGAEIADGQAIGTIANDDGTPIQVSIGDVSITEGDAGTVQAIFTVTRSGGTGAFSVSYATADGSASAPGDYVSTSGTLNFTAGLLTQTLTVTINGDPTPEGNEAFLVNLSGATDDAVLVDGQAVGTIVNDDLIFIHDVQGTAFFSPVLGGDGISAFNVRSISQVTVQAVITAIDAVGGRQGFYLMEEELDWDLSLNTSEGIFVMTRNDANVGLPMSTGAYSGLTAGEVVTITAYVMEYQAFDNLPRTFLVDPTILTQSNTTVALPTYVLDGSPGRAIPNSILSDDNPNYFDTVDDPADTFDAANDALDFFETIEGMRVTIPDMVVADGFVDGANDTARFKAYSQVHADDDQINDRGGYTIAGDPPLSPPDTADADDGTTQGGRHLHDGDVNPDIIELDFSEAGRGGTSGFHNQLSMGDFIGDVTGIIDFDFENLKFFVTDPIDTTGLGGSPTQETTNLALDARSLRIATFNVENLDPGDGAARFTALAQVIAGNLGGPDIISIEEMQDNNGAAAGDGSSPTGTSAATTWQMLADAVSLATGHLYQWVDEAPIYNAEGGEQSGNIRVGFLYNTERVTLGGLAADATLAERRAYTDRIGDGVRDAGDLIAFSDNMLGAEINAADWSGTRRSLLGEFVFNGQTVFVTANHFPSKGGSGSFYETNQNIAAGSPANADWAQRNAVARDVWAMMNAISIGSDARVVAGGDFNDFYFYRPLEVLTGYVDLDGTARTGGTRYVNLTVSELEEAERYTYAFDGRSQAIDHIVADQPLSDVASYDIVHLNTGFNTRTGGVNPALSDHDPAVAQFDFRSFAETLIGDGATNVLEGFGGNDTLRSLGGDDSLTGSAGDDRLEGGEGTDTAIFSDARASYAITQESDGSVRVVDLRPGSPDGTDTLLAMERIVFSDGQFNIAELLDPSDNPPVFTGLDATPTYVEGGARVVLDADASVSDVDTPSFAGATLVLSRQGGASADDSFDGTGTLELADGQVYLQEGGPDGPAVVGTYANADGTLAVVFNAEADQARVDAVLRQIAYANGGEPASGPIVIGYLFDNGLQATGSITVSIVATNDAPDVEGVTASAIYTPGGAAVLLGADLTITDADSTTLTGATVTIADVQAGDFLTADAGSTGLTVGYAGGVLSVSGTATLAQYRQVLATVAFSSTSANPQQRTVGWQVTDGTDASQPETTNIYFAPTLDLDGSAAGTGFSATYVENAAGVAIADSDLVVTEGAYGLISATVVLTGAQAGDALSVGTLPGSITATTDTSTPGQITVTLSGQASAGDYATALRAIGFSAGGEDPASLARSIAVTLSDGNATSPAALTTVTVTPVNDAPSGTDGSATFAEDTVYTLTTADFGFSDVDGDGLAAVIVTTLPTVGVLALNGAPVSAGQSVSAADIAAGLLRYTPPMDAFGSPLAGFGFQVRDDGGTANGGVDLDPSANSFAFNVIDNTPPLLISTSPADEGGNVALGANLVLTFNEAVQAGSGVMQIYELVNKTTSVLVATILVTDTSQVSFSGATMTVDPNANLQPGREYYLTFGSGVVTDLAGNAFAGLSSTQMNFFTVAPDTTAPLLTMTNPADDATGVSPATNLVLTFNEAVQTGTGSFEIWKLDPKFGAVLFRTISASDAGQVSVSGSQVILNPTVDLDPSSSYYVNFTAGAVRDTSGNNAAALTSQTAYNFSTGSVVIVPSLAISPANITLAEGNAGTTAYTFTVTRSGDTSGATTASWAVTGSSANPANAADFGGTLPSGTVSFIAGATTATIVVNVTGDTSFEPTEGFTVTLSNPSGSAVIATATATGTITNDDVGPPVLAISPANVTQAEGNGGAMATAFTFTVTRTGDTSGATTANWAVTGSSGNAADVFDFATAEVFPSGTVNFAAGATTATIVVNVFGDTTFEPTEGFTVTLSNPSGSATIATATATGTITNDDPNPADTVAPLLVSTAPADEVGNVAPGANLVLTFNEAVQAGTGVLQIYDNTDRGSAPVLVRTISVIDASQVSFSGSTMTVNPTADLAPSKAYYLTFGSGVVADLAGNAFAGLSATQMNFFTAAPDTTPPVLAATTPADDATGVSPAANLVLTFNEAVQAGTGSFEIWKLDPKFGAVLFRTISASDAGQVSVSGSQVTLNPTVDLDPSSSYYVNFASGVVRDLAGNNNTAVSSPTAFNFSTSAAVPATADAYYAYPAFDEADQAPLIGAIYQPETQGIDWRGVLWG